jgi:hypothetical protein
MNSLLSAPDAPPEPTPHMPLDAPSQLPMIPIETGQEDDLDWDDDEDDYEEDDYEEEDWDDDEDDYWNEDDAEDLAARPYFPTEYDNGEPEWEPDPSDEDDPDGEARDILSWLEV